MSSQIGLTSWLSTELCVRMYLFLYLSLYHNRRNLVIIGANQLIIMKTTTTTEVQQGQVAYQQGVWNTTGLAKELIASESFVATTISLQLGLLCSRFFPWYVALIINMGEPMTGGWVPLPLHVHPFHNTICYNQNFNYSW